MDGERPRADRAIDVEGFRAVRADDGGRHLGDLVSVSVSVSDSGDIRCRSSRGPGPGETPRAL
ncbi:hypothetical protein [Streptomyces sp. CAU 1734]|uniref:hypothetical protein n=1 Tax=Streptomyces sp. CAU 1734 TaxID=3140360 RepID=UPI0032605FC0